MSVKLHHWTTAMDSVREEEERNKAMMDTKSKQGSTQALTTGRKNSVIGGK